MGWDIKNNKNLLKKARIPEKINLIFEEFREKKSFRKFWGFRALNIQSFKKKGPMQGVINSLINI